MEPITASFGRISYDSPTRMTIMHWCQFFCLASKKNQIGVAAFQQSTTSKVAAAQSSLNSPGQRVLDEFAPVRCRLWSREAGMNRCAVFFLPAGFVLHSNPRVL